MKTNDPGRGLRLVAVAVALTVLAALYVLSGEGAGEQTSTSTVAFTLPPTTAAPTTTAPPPAVSSTLPPTIRPQPELAEVVASFQPFVDSPLVGISGASAVWTGEEIIVWGGQITPTGEAGFGGAFDPRAGTWRQLAPSPPARTAHTAVWAGDRMIIWGGASHRVDDGGRLIQEQLVDGLSYDPVADDWSPIPPAPMGPQSFPVLVWTGEEVIVLGGTNVRNPGILSIAAYDPATGSWRLLPELPVVPPEMRQELFPGPVAAAWTGEALVVAGGVLGPDGFAVYRPDADEWERIAGPVGLRRGHSLTWTGTEVILWGGSERDSRVPAGFALDVEHIRVRLLSTPPVTEREGHGAAWTGSRVLMWGGSIVRPLSYLGERLAFGVLYDPATDEWTELDSAGVPSGVFGFFPLEVVWLGDSALLWNGDPEESGILTLDL